MSEKEKELEKIDRIFAELKSCFKGMIKASRKIVKIAFIEEKEKI